MKRAVTLIVCAFVFAAVFARTAGAQDRPGVQELQKIQTPIDLAHISRGMKGHGLSVFEGTTIEVFDVEVVSVVKNFVPHQDEVLVLCSGWELANTRVIGGMSGSPIYLYDEDGELKLLGALAYGWSFSLKALAGITPIKYMIGELERPQARESQEEGPEEEYFFTTADLDPFADDAPGDLFTEAYAELRNLSRPRAEIQRAPRRDEIYSANDPMSMTPVMTPISISGLSQRTIDRLAPNLRSAYLEPMAGGGTSASMLAPGEKVELSAGSAIGVQLMKGDIEATGIGTCTYVGDRGVLAFGHPMYGRGEYDLPMTTAYIHTTVGSIQRSFKFGSAIEQVGTIRADRQSCIVGEFGAPPSMLPVTVRAQNGDTGVGDTFNVEVIRHKTLTSWFIEGILYDAMSAQEQTWGPAFFRRKVTIDFGDPRFEDLVLENVFASSSGVESGMLDPVTSFMFNDFENLKIERVTVELTAFERNPACEMMRIRYNGPATLEPGESSSVTVTLRPERAPRFDVTVPFMVPEDFADGEYNLSVTRADRLLRTPARVLGIEDLVDFYRNADKYQRDALAIVFEPADPMLDLDGNVIEQLPPSVQDTLLDSEQRSSVRQSFRMRDGGSIVSTDGWLPINAMTVQVRVKAKD
ncbi:MAG: hypothetical protein NUW37_11780 [Planctomycetes bacterium]|nr:hypothetical protein [Planctomycetota bacterium]